MAVGLLSLLVGIRALRHDQTQVAEAARGLAIQVAGAEAEARRQLLGRHDHPINVEFRLLPAQGLNAAGASSQGSFQEVVDYYRKLRPSRMLITGAGGSGKTVLAIELILGLLDGQADDAPVPVRISAASLDSTRRPELAMRAWIMHELRTTYRLPKAATDVIVDAGMVLPVLDGLDEMDADEHPGYTEPFSVAAWGF
jgi:predicted NACHT family NTPase